MKKRVWTILLAAVMLLSLLAGCSERKATSNGYAAEDAYYGKVESESGLVTEDKNTAASTAVTQNRKLIRTVNLNAETEDMDTLLTRIDEKVTALEGYMENREVQSGSSYSSYRSRYANLVIRIPVSRADEFVTHVSGVSNITSSTESNQDVTLTYISTESRVKALQTEETRLLELLAKAETMSDLLEIESRLTEVRYELENVTSQLRTYDNLVDYATVKLYIAEVQKLTPVEEETFWQRVSGGFVESLEDLRDGFEEMVVWILVKLPYLLLMAVLVAVVLVAVKLKRKKRKNQKPQQTPEENI